MVRHTIKYMQMTKNNRFHPLSSVSLPNSASSLASIPFSSYKRSHPITHMYTHKHTHRIMDGCKLGQLVQRVTCLLKCSCLGCMWHILSFFLFSVAMWTTKNAQTFQQYKSMMHFKRSTPTLASSLNLLPSSQQPSSASQLLSVPSIPNKTHPNENCNTRHSKYIHKSPMLLHITQCHPAS